MPSLSTLLQRFAFLTVVYILGSKLRTAQLAMLSLLYVIWAVAFALVAITHLQSLESLVSDYPDFIRSVGWHIPWSYFGWAITLAGLIISSYFVYGVRSNAVGLAASDT